jgi:hypothetical protein
MRLSHSCKARARDCFILLALGSACAGSPAAAQQPSQEQVSAIRQNCRSDFIAHCSSVQPGGKEAFECLERNMAQLSAACRGAVSAAMPKSAPAAASAPAPAKPEAPATASAPPHQAVPHSSPPPASTPHAPAQHPAPRPSTAATAPAAPPPPPEIALAPMPPLPLRVELLLLRICAADKNAHCSVVTPGGGRIIACLADNEPALQPQCKEAMLEAKKYD